VRGERFPWLQQGYSLDPVPLKAYSFMGMGGFDFTITDVSATSGVAVPTLRNWDAAGVLPAHRKRHGRTTRRYYGMRDVFAACVCKTLSKFGFGWDALKEVTRLIKTASDLELEHARIVMEMEVLDPKPDSDGTVLVNRVLHLSLTDEDYAALIQKGCTFQLNLKDLVQHLRKEMQEMGLNAEEPIQGQLVLN